MEKISWADRVKIYSIDLRRKETPYIKKHEGRYLVENCLLKPVMEGKIEGTERRGKRSKQLLHDLKEREDTGSSRRGTRSSLWGYHVGRGCGPVVRQTAC
jgi:hypothetical protein